jgi:hypothetical protein
MSNESLVTLCSYLACTMSVNNMFTNLSDNLEKSIINLPDDRLM